MYFFGQSFLIKKIEISENNFFIESLEICGKYGGERKILEIAGKKTNLKIYLFINKYILNIINNKIV